MTQLRGSAPYGGTLQALHCVASGWRLRISSADSNREATCPLCGQQVQPRSETIGGSSVWVIKEHSRLREPRPIVG